MVKSISYLRPLSVQEHLDSGSIDRLRLAEVRVKRAYNKKQDLKSMFGTRLNFWEIVVKEVFKPKEPLTEYLAFFVLFEDIEKNGIKEPISIYCKENGYWQLRNGHHRLAIALLLGIEKIGVEYSQNEV